MKLPSNIDRATIERARDSLCGTDPVCLTAEGIVSSIVDDWLEFHQPPPRFDKNDDDRHVPVGSPARMFATAFRSCGIPAGARVSSDYGCNGIAVVHEKGSGWVSVDRPHGSTMLKIRSLPALMNALRPSCACFTPDMMQVKDEGTHMVVGVGFEAAWEVIQAHGRHITACA